MGRVWYDDGTTAPASRYNALTPARVLDTRSAAASGNPSNPIGVCANPSTCAAIRPRRHPHRGRPGRGPPTGATAVVMNVTAVNPSAESFLTVWPSADPRPNASNLNFAGGQTVPNLVAVKLGTDGRVKVFNAAGTTHVIADVAGWFNDGT